MFGIWIHSSRTLENSPAIFKGLIFFFGFVCLFFHQLFWKRGCLHLNVKKMKTGINNVLCIEMLSFIIWNMHLWVFIVNFPASILLFPKKLWIWKESRGPVMCMIVISCIYATVLLLGAGLHLPHHNEVCGVEEVVVALLWRGKLR